MIMAKKNYDKKVAKKEVNEVLDKAIVSDAIVKETPKVVEETVEEEPLLEESLALDMDKLSEDLEEMKKEIFEEEPKKEEEVVIEKPKENKTFVNRIFGLMWNGQEYDY
jgi:hypothetical protein